MEGYSYTIHILIRSSISHRLSPLLKIQNYQIVENEGMLNIRTVLKSKGHSNAFMPLTFWVLFFAMRREGTSVPEFPFLPFSSPSPPFSKLSKYARGTPDRWTLISLAIWPQFVFLANEADYWAGWLMALRSTGLLLIYMAIWIFQRNLYNNKYWNSFRCNPFSTQVY